MLDEILDEISDFFEDFAGHLGKRPSRPVKQKDYVINGVVTRVRPAYIFAERVDNLLRILFGISIIISAVTSTFLGFQTLSGLLETLIGSLWGRFLMLVIGLSYLVIAVWKLMHISSKS